MTLMPSRGQLARPAPEVIAELFAREGVRRIYTVPGDMAYGLLRAFAAAGLDVFSVRSQATAVFASAGDNYSEGRLASAVLITRGPALANALAALSSVVAHGVPMVLLSPCESLTDMQSGAFQGSMHLALEAGSPCDVLRFEDPDSAGGRLASLLADTAKPDRRSAVVLLERRLLGSLMVAPDIQPPRLSRRPDLAALQTAAEMLNAAKNPIIVVGHRARWSASFETLATFARRLNAPLCPTGLSIGFGGTRLPSLGQDEVHRELSGADAVLLVGASLDWTLRSGIAVPNEAKVISLREEGEPGFESRRGDIVLSGEIGQTLDALCGMFDTRAGLSPRPEGRGRLPAPPPPTLFARIADRLADDFPTETALVLDGSNGLIHAARRIIPDADWARITPGISGHLGAGIGHALGAAASGRYRRVILLTGDFSLGLALADLESLVRYDAPVTVLVNNNRGLASESNQLAGADRRIADYTPATDHARIMRGFGGVGHRIDSLDGWAAIRDRVVQGRGPCLVDISEHADTPE
ncbi:thiamine pyrophosphate-dependent enzyme [Salipiger sp. H15]|uniref:Thiamine pyrophosphate-dependent enzyme n=1 Tax=Alloyangia sp. H15 TaxID=3029062 RepID=A0AAU8ANE9_9RHOB